ncbi:MAG: YkgJ family cysteine cluster protein [Candidatus Bilamarchaeaceae archaeon]
MFSPCRLCNGNCCISFVITVTSFDILRIVKATGLKPEEFAELRRLDILSFDDNHVVECKNGKYTESYLLTLKSHPCYFFDSKKGCKIHKAKPLACRIYPHNENGDFGKRSLCPFLPFLFFHFLGPSKKLLQQYRKEKKLYANLVKKCNEKKLNIKNAFRFLTSTKQHQFNKKT